MRIVVATVVPRTIIISLTTLLSIVVSVAFAQTEIDSLVKRRVDHRETPGIVVGIFENGKTKYYSYGVMSSETNIPVSPKTLFEIGSISKVFTTTILSLMVEQQHLSLKDPVTQYLPEDITVPSFNNQQITILDLATATSGLPRMPFNFIPEDLRNPYIDYTEENLYAFLNSYTLTDTPGVKYEYSNLGMGLLGNILTRHTGKTYNTLVKEMIAIPLELVNTELNFPTHAGIKSLASGHRGSTVSPSWTWNDQSVLSPAGGLRSSAEDVLKFLVAQMNDDLSPSWKNAVQRASSPLRKAGTPNMKIGLGWHILNDKIVWHNGRTGGFRTFAGFDPAQKKAVVVLTNSDTGADDLGFHLLDSTLSLKPLKEVWTPDESELIRYVGKYEIDPSFHINITNSGNRLFVQATGQALFEIYAENENIFTLKVVDAKIEFVQGSDGTIDRLILYQHGMKKEAKKIR